MSYRKPNRFSHRIFNPIAIKLGVGGTKALDVKGRRSGRPQRVAVIPLDHEGVRYLVSPRGETDWVKNLRAAGEGELSGKGGTERVRATEVPVPERPPILAAYQRLAGAAVKSHFKALPDPSDHPVFRLEPSQSARSV